MKVSFDMRAGRERSGAYLPRWIVDARLDEPLARLHQRTEPRIVRYPRWIGLLLAVGGGVLGWACIFLLAGLW